MGPMKRAITTMMASLITTFSVALHAAPDGYAINSDSGSGDSDSLYRINLSTGEQTRLGRVQSLNQTKIDVEGLAFSPDGTLYGVDDDSMTLFPINTDNGTVINAQEFALTGLPGGGGNDFGLTFACDGYLYATSVGTNGLYRVNLNGTTTKIGNLGAGINISALAAYGDKLYGLSNGLKAGGAPDTRTLYNINPQTGAALPIGALGGAAASYSEAGLAFDSGGQLWAITDRRAVPEGSYGSQVLRIDTGTGAATLVSTTAETGFESLAITVPRGCDVGNGKKAEFIVQKRFVDLNTITPVTIDLNCTTGLPLQQMQTVLPNEGLYGDYEVNFIVESFDDGQLSCTVTEAPVNGYTPSYTCLGESTCLAAQSDDSCSFSEVTIDSKNHCQVQNYPDPVHLKIDKQWLFEAEEIGVSATAEIELECNNAWDSTGESGVQNMSWSWDIEGDTILNVDVYPSFDGTTACRVIESFDESAVESDNGCIAWNKIAIGQGSKTCTLLNTVFLEGIPTLSDYGKLLFALLMLASGLMYVRRP